MLLVPIYFVRKNPSIVRCVCTYSTVQQSGGCLSNTLEIYAVIMISLSFRGWVRRPQGRVTRCAGCWCFFSLTRMGLSRESQLLAMLRTSEGVLAEYRRLVDVPSIVSIRVAMVSLTRQCTESDSPFPTIFVITAMYAPGQQIFPS